MALSDPYYHKYAALKRRCQSVKQDSERLAGRVYHAQLQVRRTRRDCRLLSDRLDYHRDDYRQAALRSPPQAAPPSTTAEDLPDQAPRQRLKAEKKTRRRVLNEPKKPSNPFFQFCQEQRSLLLSQMKNTAGMSRQGLTKQLAANWSHMSTEEKQKYVDRYERDKRQYLIAMQKLQIKTPRPVPPP